MCATIYVFPYMCYHVCCHMCSYLSDFRPKYVLRSLLSTRIATKNGLKYIISFPSRAVNPWSDTFSSSSSMAPMHSCIICARADRNCSVLCTLAGTSNLGKNPTKPH